MDKLFSVIRFTPPLCAKCGHHYRHHNYLAIGGLTRFACVGCDERPGCPVPGLH